ncbi:MAG: hypothetical protein K6F14_09105 [Clostridiales bacterium]|nr:hypothetical protein [Clostridiales bacterium]
MDNTPLSPWKYFGLEILYSIPIIGWIFLVCHAIGASNVNKRNFARSYFCFIVVILVFCLIVFLIGNGSGLIQRIIDAINGVAA